MANKKPEDKSTTLTIKDVVLDLSKAEFDLGSMAALEEFDEKRYGNAFEFLRQLGNDQSVGKMISTRDLQALVWMATWNQHEGKIVPKDIKLKMADLTIVGDMLRSVLPKAPAKAK